MVDDGKKKESTLAVHGNKHDQLYSPTALYNKETKNRSLWRQCLMNAAIVLLVTGSGMPIGFSAILIPQLQAPGSSLPTDNSMASWIASVHSTMTPVGALLAGPLMDRLGRRRVLQLSVVPMVAGWVLMGFAPNHLCLAAGRMLGGFAVGMTPGSSQVLIGEISEPHLRGVFSSAPSLAYSLGILVVYALGSVFNWRVVAALSALLPVTGLIMLIALPESPVWLVNKGFTDKARKSLLWLRGGDQTKANQELHLLVVHYKSEQERQLASRSEDETCQVVPEQLSSLIRPEVYKPFFIILTFCLLQILSGSYIVIFFSVNLISSASGNSETDSHSLTIAVMTAFVRFVVSIITTVSLLRLGRRKIGIISGVGTAISCFMLYGFLELKNRKITRLSCECDTYIIAGFIMIYVALNTFGIFGLPCMMIGEVLPSRVRGFVSGILLMLINLMIFSTTKLYLNVAQILGPDGVFFCFGIVAILATIFIYLYLPETRDRPLTQIEQYFATGKNYIWSRRDKELMAKNNNMFV